MTTPPRNKSEPANGRTPGSLHGRHSDAEQIQAEMAQVRDDLRHDIVGVSRKIKQVSHWQYYVKKYPLACVGLAALIGYALIPSRGRQTVVATDEQIKDLAEAGKLHVVSDPPPNQQAGFGQSIALALGTMAARAAMAYVGKSLAEQFDTASQTQINE